MYIHHISNSLLSNYNYFRCVKESTDVLPAPAVLKVNVFKKLAAKKYNKNGNSRTKMLCKQRKFTDSIKIKQVNDKMQKSSQIQMRQM